MPDQPVHDAITATVKTYVEGMCCNDPSMIREAMHEKMCCIGHYEGALEWDTRDAFIKGVQDATEKPDPKPWHMINQISVCGDIATVQVENIWLGMHFDDMLTLLYHDGKWVIVSKVFYLRPAS